EVNEGNFPSLSPAQHYAILSALPAKTLTAADRDRLSGLAAEAGRLDEALAHAQAALSRDKGGRRFERHRAVVGLLLKLERAGEAEETARRWAASSDPTPEQRATMAELLARHGRQPVAEELFVAALGAKYLAPERRFGLLCRRAAVAKGRQRWDLLLEAARIVPAESPARDQCLDTIDAELVDPSQAEAAAQLAAAAKDPRIKASLLLAEARLHIDPKRRAEAYWQVYKLGWLSDDLAYAACYAWNSSGEPRRVIEFAETRLRNGKGLSLDVSRALETAYRAAGRERDARRAAPGDPEPTDRTQGSPARDAGQGGGMF
ncbi:MAG: hypothetical protein NTW96_13180, partial [Planctomycetia bacterium]|nr:hypothetical protein [Planctomycetia bacterium]